MCILKRQLIKKTFSILYYGMERCRIFHVLANSVEIMMIREYSRIM
jgi:hypothetical protein